MDNSSRKVATLHEQADTYDHCVEKITAKVGEGNFQVLHRSTIRHGGFLGFFEKEGIEIEYKLLPPKQPNHYIPQSSPLYASPAIPMTDKLEETKQKILSTVAPKLPDPQMMEMVKNMEYIKKLLENAHLDARPADHPTIGRIETMLYDNEFTPLYVKNITERIRKNFSVEELDDFDMVQDAVIEWIGESIEIDNNTLRPSFPKVIILVGPTGVGKTTTVAKIAAKYCSSSSLNDNYGLRVRMITIDSYRIKAREQLETYGEYMDVPVFRANKLEDLEDLLATSKGEADVVLIDTIGFSPLDFKRIAQMRAMLDLRGWPVEVYLTMSATTKASDMCVIMDQFETFQYSSVVLTKTDETKKIGNFISALSERHKSLAFITDGQGVPNDIRLPVVVKLLIALDGFTIDRERIEELFPSLSKDGEV